MFENVLVKLEIHMIYYLQVDRITGENEKFAENNKVLQEQNNQFIENNKQLTLTVTELKEQADKFKEIYQKLLRENEKLAKIRDGLQEQLSVSCFHEFLAQVSLLGCMIFILIIDIKILSLS